MGLAPEGRGAHYLAASSPRRASGGPAPLSRPEGYLRTQRGFTLIELLIVVVIVGILAAIAIPKFANTKQKSYVAQMKSDLRNLATAEEAFFYDSTYYTTNLTTLSRFSPSAGVTITINEGTPGGWSATAKHAHVTRECYLYSGNATPVGNATVDGKITCT